MDIVVQNYVQRSNHEPWGGQQTAYLRLHPMIRGLPLAGDGDISGCLLIHTPEFSCLFALDLDGNILLNQATLLLHNYSTQCPS